MRRQRWVRLVGLMLIGMFLALVGIVLYLPASRRSHRFGYGSSFSIFGATVGKQHELHSHSRLWEDFYRYAPNFLKRQFIAPIVHRETNLFLTLGLGISAVPTLWQKARLSPKILTEGKWIAASHRRSLSQSDRAFFFHLKTTPEGSVPYRVLSGTRVVAEGRLKVARGVGHDSDPSPLPLRRGYGDSALSLDWIDPDNGGFSLSVSHPSEAFTNGWYWWTFTVPRSWGFRSQSMATGPFRSTSFVTMHSLDRSTNHTFTARVLIVLSAGFLPRDSNAPVKMQITPAMARAGIVSIYAMPPGEWVGDAQGWSRRPEQGASAAGSSARGLSLRRYSMLVYRRELANGPTIRARLRERGPKQPKAQIWEGRIIQSWKESDGAANELLAQLEHTSFESSLHEVEVEGVLTIMQEFQLTPNFFQ